MGFQKADDGFRIHIILMLCRFHRLRFNKESSCKPVCTAIIAGDSQHLSQMFFFTLLVSIQKRHVTLASAPEHIIRTSQFDCGVDGILYLNGSPRNDIKVGICCGSVHVARVTEYVCSAPQQLDARFSLFLFQISNNFLQIRFIFFDGISLIAKVHIMEAIIFDSHLLHELESRISLVLCSLHLVGISFPRKALCSHAELVTAFSAQRVPPGHRKFQPVFHLLSHYHSFRIIVTESHRVLTFYTFEFNLSNAGKILFVCHCF